MVKGYADHTEAMQGATTSIGPLLRGLMTLLIIGVTYIRPVTETIRRVYKASCPHKARAVLSTQETEAESRVPSSLAFPVFRTRCPAGALKA